ncbi:hypothetical protein [Leptospira sp. GIMC2001]|uniref:hypothetical protein n=1 Tax=Leptospira sp. GIMC2001 TaxID=1513297 RepID=UPI00234AE7ED|nr:hypothetical protein [Leptospira sp. GIMC2001]WCL50976.1 hypothetical protein O4O04_09235 [Leptospira sp. GIMC2001]
MDRISGFFHYPRLLVIGILSTILYCNIPQDIQSDELTRTEIRIQKRKWQVNPFIDPYLLYHLNHPIPIKIPQYNSPLQVRAMDEYVARRSLERNRSERITSSYRFQRWYHNNNVRPSLFKK